MDKDEKHFTLRVDEGLLRKFKCIASREGRSLNAMLLWVIREGIAEFEAQHGPIPLGEKMKKRK